MVDIEIIKKKRGRPPKVKSVDTAEIIPEIIPEIIESPEIIDEPINTEPIECPSEKQSDSDVEELINRIVEQKMARYKKPAPKPRKQRAKAGSGFTLPSFNPAYLLPIALPFIRLGIEYAVKYGSQNLPAIPDVKKKSEASPPPPPSHFAGVL